MTNLYEDVLMTIVREGFRRLWGKRRDFFTGMHIKM